MVGSLIIRENKVKKLQSIPVLCGRKRRVQLQRFTSSLTDCEAVFGGFLTGYLPISCIRLAYNGNHREKIQASCARHYRR